MNGDPRPLGSCCVCCEECSNDCTEDEFGPCLRRCVCDEREDDEDNHRGEDGYE